MESLVAPGTCGTKGLFGFGASCCAGTLNSVWQVGQLIWWPIHNSSQAISCPHFEQLNFNSAISYSFTLAEKAPFVKAKKTPARHMSLPPPYHIHPFLRQE